MWACARACYSLSACVGDMRRHRVFTVHYHSERLAVVSFLEGGLTTDQHEEDDPQTPDICRDTERMPSVHTNISFCARNIRIFKEYAHRNERMADQQRDAQMAFLLSDLDIKKKTKKKTEKLLPPQFK